MSTDPLRQCVGSIRATNERLTRAAEHSREAWSDEARARFDRSHMDRVLRAVRMIESELEAIADSAGAIESALKDYR